MNNKGFTLIELLAVIIILISMSLIVVTSISSSLERRDTKECEEEISLAKNAAKIYFSLNDSNSVTISELKENNYFNNDNKISKLKDNDRVEYTATKYKFVGTDECKEKDS